jgi:gag-polypeptide of LTR copia-type
MKRLCQLFSCVLVIQPYKKFRQKLAAGAWNNLEDTFRKKTVTNRLRLKQIFQSLRMDEGTTLKSHISEYTALFIT